MKRTSRNCWSATVGSGGNITVLLLSDSLSEIPGFTPWWKVFLPVKSSGALSLPPHPWISHIILYYATETVRLAAKSLTITRDDPERNCVPGFLDQVDDVRVWLVCDGAAVHSQYSVPDFQLPAAIRRAALYDSSYFVGHGHTSISSFCLFACKYCVLE